MKDDVRSLVVEVRKPSREGWGWTFPVWNILEHRRDSDQYSLDGFQGTL